MNKVIFVDSLKVYSSSEHISLGQLSLASILVNNKIDVELVDFKSIFIEGNMEWCEDYNKRISSMGEYILKLHPDIIGFYTICDSYHDTLNLSQYIKGKDKNIKIIFGGPQASLTAKLSMEKFPWIDVICMGESEKIILPLVNNLRNNLSLKDIPSIIYRENNEIICNETVGLIDDLDKLPLLRYSLYKNMNKLTKMPLDVGRGCPFSCTYCSTKTFWKQKFRLKSAKRILDEIQYVMDNYNIRKFDFVHDLFTANKFKLLEFCDLLLERKLDITWTCSSRVDTLTKSMIEKMYKSGCRGIYLGIETGSERMQKVLKKNLKLDNVWNIIDEIKKFNIKLIVSFIYGFPNETLEDVQKTLDMIRIAKEKGVDNVQLHLFSILPETEIFNCVKDKLVFSENLSDICETSDINDCIDLIKSNPLIFPQYFEYKTELRQSLCNLDKFINIILSFMCMKMPCTYAILIRNYDNNLLNLFLDFKKVNHEFSSTIKEMFLDKELISSNSCKKNRFVLKEFQMLKNLICNVDLKIDKLLIREIFAFEYSIFKFIFIDKNIEEVNIYKFNVYDIKKNGFSPEKDYRKDLKVKFLRGNKNKMKVIEIA